MLKPGIKPGYSNEYEIINLIKKLKQIILDLPSNFMLQYHDSSKHSVKKISTVY